MHNPVLLSDINAGIPSAKSFPVKTKERFLLSLCKSSHKRNWVRKCMTLALVLMPLVRAQAQFTYTNDGSAVTITGYTGPSGAVIIPSLIEGVPVRAIGDSAFFGKVVSSVTIPDSVNLISDYAFWSCYMTNVTFGNGVSIIGNFAFYGCQQLKGVVIPNSVTNLGSEVFGVCSQLGSV